MPSPLRAKNRPFLTRPAEDRPAMRGITRRRCRIFGSGYERFAIDTGGLRSNNQEGSVALRLAYGVLSKWERAVSRRRNAPLLVMPRAFASLVPAVDISPAMFSTLDEAGG